MLWEVVLYLGECGFKHMCLTTEPLSTNFGQSVRGKKECSNTQLGERYCIEIQNWEQNVISSPNHMELFQG